ncbi:hypothetical protein ACG9X2_17040 [Acinetobacter bereziniae]|uniref:hypothetical protein n=1 Tax=Acinetobacter bereziniae TaxID=106648 RepID=UPI003AF79CBD
MSVLLTILIVLAAFHLFYQSVIVQANHQLLQDEIKFQQLMFEVYLKREKVNLAPIEVEFVNEFKAHQVHFADIVKETSLLDYLIFTFKESKGKSTSKKKIDSNLVRKDLQVLERGAVDVLVRSIMVNSFLFLLLLSPFIMLLKFLAIIQNKKFDIEDKLHDFSNKYC